MRRIALFSALVVGLIGYTAYIYHERPAPNTAGEFFADLVQGLLVGRSPVIEPTSFTTGAGQSVTYRLGLVGRKSKSTSGVDIVAIEFDSPAREKGLLSGDVIVAVNGAPVDGTDQLSQIIQSSYGRTLGIKLERSDSEVAPIRISPIPIKTNQFIGEIAITLEDDGRTTKLIKDINYVDPHGRFWPVPEGTIVDGASIPQPLWSIVGGPFSGRYRAASVIHDYYCETKIRDWLSVHRVFYDAMITSGVDPDKARIMYAAVLRFGPRWKLTAPSHDMLLCTICGKYSKWQHNIDQKELQEIKRLISNKDLTAFQIEKLVSSTFEDKPRLLGIESPDEFEHSLPSHH